MFLCPHVVCQVLKVSSEVRGSLELELKAAVAAHGAGRWTLHYCVSLVP